MNLTKRAEVLAAWIKGEKIRVFDPTFGEWTVVPGGCAPAFVDGYEYDVAPKPARTHRYCIAWLANFDSPVIGLPPFRGASANLELHFDSEGKLIKAEVL